MIDTLLKLLDRLIQLVKRRKEVEERTFELLIKPMYTDLETIHKDYLLMLEKCEVDLKENKLKDIAKRLRTERLELEPLRFSISSFAASYLKNPKLSHYTFFFLGVSNYFSVPLAGCPISYIKYCRELACLFPLFSDNLTRLDHLLLICLFFDFFAFQFLLYKLHKSPESIKSIQRKRRSFNTFFRAFVKMIWKSLNWFPILIMKVIIPVNRTVLVHTFPVIAKLTRYSA